MFLYLDKILCSFHVFLCSLCVVTLLCSICILCVDWREKGFETPPKNQKSCGSCYAFSVAMSIEGQVFRRTGRLVPLSEQQIVDCSVEIGNHGCSGGSLKNTLKYLKSTRGLMRDVDYPYASTVSTTLVFECRAYFNKKKLSPWCSIKATKMFLQTIASCSEYNRMGNPSIEGRGSDEESNSNSWPDSDFHKCKPANFSTVFAWHLWWSGVQR